MQSVALKTKNRLILQYPNSIRSLSLRIRFQEISKYSKADIKALLKTTMTSDHRDAVSLGWDLLRGSKTIPEWLLSELQPDLISNAFNLMPQGDWDIWAFLDKNWMALLPTVRESLTPDHLVSGLTSSSHDFSEAVLKFVDRHWSELSQKQKQAFSGVRLQTLLQAPHSELVWSYLNSHWNDLAISPSVITPAIAMAAISNQHLQSAYNTNDAWRLIASHWEELSLETQRSAVAAVMGHPNKTFRHQVEYLISKSQKSIPRIIIEDISRAKALEKNGFLLLPQLILSKTPIDEMLGVLQKIQTGGFDLENPLHVDLNYVLLAKEILQQRSLSPKESYSAFIEMVQTMKRGKHLPVDLSIQKNHLLQMRGLAFEADLLREKILALQGRAKALNLDFVVNANLSAGAVSLTPIVEERDGETFIIGTDIPVWQTKIGSTESHNDEFVMRPDLFSSTRMQTLTGRQALVVVVDASTSVGDSNRTSPHIPDGFKGYRNHTIALNAVLGFRSLPNDFLVDQTFMEQLVKTEPFEEVVRKFQHRESGARPYKFYFHYPGQKTLYLRQGKKKDQSAPKLDDVSVVQGPAMVFIQSAIEPEAVPKNIQKEFIGGTHSPAYFDDTDHYNQFFFDYEEGYGFHLSRSYALRSRAIYRELLTYLGKPIGEEESIARVGSFDREIDAVVVDLDGTIAKTDQPLDARAIQVLRSLRASGKRIIFATDDLAANVDKRIESLVKQLWTAQPSLLDGLWFATDGGSLIYRFSAPNQKVMDDHYNPSSRISGEERTLVLALLNDRLKGRFAIDRRPERASPERRIDLRNVQDRDSFIAGTQQLLAQNGLDYQVYKAGRTSVKLVKTHKAEAVEHLMHLLGIDERKMLILADSARTYQIDRKLLSRFVNAISVNVGKASRSIGLSNPQIIQPETGITGALGILESLARAGRLPMRPLLPFQHVFTKPSGKDSDSEGRDDGRKAAAAWSLNENYLRNWAHEVETRWLIPLMSVVFVFAPLLFRQIPNCSLIGAMLAFGLAFMVPHRQRILNPNVLLLGAGTITVSGIFMSSLQGLLAASLSSDPVQWLFGFALAIGAISAVELLTRIHWHNNNVSPLTHTLRAIFSAV